jgi:flavin reductase (DIM6/NTAB) family NADH-FMN oxidoreductase RutF
MLACEVIHVLGVQRVRLYLAEVVAPAAHPDGLDHLTPSVPP